MSNYFNRFYRILKFLLYNFISYSVGFTISLAILFTIQGLILSGSFNNDEFPALIGINSAILGIHAPRPKAKESKGNGEITTARLISFMGSAIIHSEIMLFCIIVLLSGRYSDQNQMTIYIGNMMTILTIYVSRPKYKPTPVFSEKEKEENNSVQLVDEESTVEFTESV
jgi:hypothetical protein